MKKKIQAEKNSYKIVENEVVKGGVFWFDPGGKTKVNISPLAIILSGKLQNELGDHLVIITASSKSIKDVRDFFEVVSKVGNKKIKAIVFSLHAIGKKFFLDNAKYLGKLEEKIIKKINGKIKLLLELG